MAEETLSLQAEHHTRCTLLEVEALIILSGLMRLVIFPCVLVTNRQRPVALLGWSGTKREVIRAEVMLSPTFWGGVFAYCE